MKKIGFLLFFVLLGLGVSAQKFAGLDKSPMDLTMLRKDRNAKPIAKIFYSRPQLAGRKLADLAPDGKVWRLGANEATELIINEPIKVGGTKLAAGTYTMYAVPSASKWTIVISKDTDVWGSYAYNEANDVLRVDAPTMKAKETIDAFSIDFNYGDKAIYFGWGDVIAKLPIEL